jgi:uncharacterized membrane protein
VQGLRLGGHPLHPALVHFPVACWTVAPVLDAAFLLTRQPLWWQASFACIAVGVAVALLAMTAGLLDLMALPLEHPAQATAQRHLLLVSSAWCVFAVSLLFRPLRVAPGATQAWLALGLSLSGFLLLAFGAYAGARLVYEFGVGQSRRPSP